jgi:hypothetical protein
MIFRREAWGDVLKRRCEWHLWFAWHPVVGRDFFAWLEWVERKGEPAYESGWDWEYRECAPHSKERKA